MEDLQRVADRLAQGASEEDVARALLEVTLDAAPPEVAEAVRIAALPAWFDVELLAYLLETDETDAEHCLTSMTAFSFVQPREAGGYVYHEATRARLLDAWQTPERRERFVALAERLAQRYLSLARRHVPRLHGPEYVAALHALDAAYPNIRAAWENVVSAERWGMARRLASTLADYQQQRGLWQDWIAWTESGIATSAQSGDDADVAALQNNLGAAYAALPTGDRGANLARAIACYEAALRFYTPEAAPLDYAMTQNNLGVQYYEQGELEKAGAAFRRAVEITPENGVRQMALGSVLRRLGREDEAAVHLARARERLPEDDHYNLACLEAITGNVDAALEHLEKALAEDPSQRDWAARDPDLEPLHGHPRFAAIVGRGIGA